MQLTRFFLASTALVASVAAVSQQGILNLQNQILNVINDVVQQKYSVIANDYSSTGRSLAFLQVDVLKGAQCPRSGGGISTGTANEAIVFLQATQQSLSLLSQDIINGDQTRAINDVCTAVKQYGAVAGYVDKVRTQ